MKKLLLIFLSVFAYFTSNAQLVEFSLLKAAESGDVDAQKYVATKYYNGRGSNKIGQNYEKAYQWFVRAAEQGDSESQYFLATDEQLRHLVNSSVRSTEYWLGAAANNGHRLAIDQYGELLYNKGKYKEAMPFLLQAANQGSPNSHYILAIMHIKGQGTNVNEEIATKEFQYVTASFEQISSDKKIWNGFQEKTQNYLSLIAIKSYEWLAKIYSKDNYSSSESNINSSVSNINKAIELAKKNNYNNNLYVKLLDTRATVYLFNDDNNKCKKDWDEIIKIYPNYASEVNTFLTSVMTGNVDYLVPNSKIDNDNTLAIIIANENYKRVPNVPHAINDGIIFKKYINKTFGVPEENIEYLEDASLNDIKYALTSVSQKCDGFKDRYSVILYYAGHGVPDEKSGEAFLLPVDGFGTDPSSGLNLDDFYATLSEMPAKSIVVLLDACFSGAKRDGGMLMATRGITIKPKMHVPDGKLIVLSATSNDETAFPIEQQKHGLFTYTLLRKIQESGGDITWGELADYVTETVKNRSIDLNGKLQSPTVSVSSSMKEIWRDLKLR